jgi:uncharacterized membrane protein YoaK (UPF0700 family)
MFRREGAQRPHRHNQILAGYLAAVAGLVNSEGFVTINSFTSHVTGNVGRLADDVARGRPTAAVLALTMIIAFFLGAFLASMLLESDVLERPRAYATLLFSEAMLLVTFTGISLLMDTTNPRVHDVQALILCASMGLQNSLVTRLSGAVVRTTHLTGTVTDLGIEAARWFRYWRAQVSTHLVVGDARVELPQTDKTMLLTTVFVSFILSSVCGALLVVHLERFAFVVPIVLLLAGAAFAFATSTALVPGERK